MNVNFDSILSFIRRELFERFYWKVTSYFVIYGKSIDELQKKVDKCLSESTMHIRFLPQGGVFKHVDQYGSIGFYQPMIREDRFKSTF